MILPYYKKVYLENFLEQSNLIENVQGESALRQASEAFSYLKKQDDALTEEDIKQAHKIMLKELQPGIAGEYRDCNVRVGNDYPPGPEKVPELMADLVDKTPETPLEALDWHVEFEKIHPFQDGNGRIGRMIYAWHCFKQGNTPIMFTKENVDGYYSLFNTDKKP